jgi:hypothetical protein
MAKESRDLAAALLSGLKEGDVGASPVAQVKARRLARAACSVAMLRAKALKPAEAEDLLPGLREADSAWRGLP